MVTIRLCWYSVTPTCVSGYGNATRNMVKWLRKQGHDVWIATKHERDDKESRWQGFDVLQGNFIPGINHEMKLRQTDYCLSMFDIWTLDEPLNNWVSWTPIDTQFASPEIVNQAKNCEMVIAMSKHGEAELRRYGFDPMYVPIGVDTDVFKPRPILAQKIRKQFGFEDNFLVGAVGANYPDDRKGFILLFQAFREFHKNHPDARLYIHTQIVGQGQVPLLRVIKDLGLTKLVATPDQHSYYYNRYTEKDVAAIYSAMDVFCLPTKGEGFGMPLIEAQACGTPVITTDATTGAELTKTGWLIDTDLDDLEWTGKDTWKVVPKVSRIVSALEVMYALKDSPDKETPEETRQPILDEYSWPVVFEKNWKPILVELEKRLGER